jgi:hypothetical protein
MTTQDPERRQSPPSPGASLRRQPPGTSGTSHYDVQATPGGSEKPATQPAGARGEGNATIVALVLASVAIIVALPAVAVLCVMLGVAGITLGASQSVTVGGRTQFRGVANGGLVSGIIAALIGFGILVFGLLGIVSLVN